MSEPISDPVPAGDEAPMGDPSEDRANRDLHEGTAHGGPLNGEHVTSRYPKGVVAISNESNRAWIYDRHDDGDFHVREDDGRALDDNAHEDAANGADYDVQAVA